MAIWNNFLCYRPNEYEDVLLRMTNEKTNKRYYTIGHMKDNVFNSRGMEPSSGFDDSDYTFQWIYVSEMEQLLDEDGLSMPGLVNGDW